MYIFDVDGTLLYTIESISYFVNESLRHFGLGEVPTEKVRSFVGNASRVLIKDCFKYLGVEDDKLLEEVLDFYLKAYDENPAYLTRPYEGMVDALDELKKRGELVTAFSNKPHETCRKLLEEVFGKGYFDYILGQGDFYKRKPSPEGIMIIKEKFGVDFSDIFYFGDSEVDMKCGKNANIYTVGCSWGYRDREVLEKEGPNLIIDSPSQICSIRRV